MEKVKFYHTGDLCFLDSDGNIMYSGRIDNQVKIQGYRIELGEIEFLAREYLNQTNVIAIAYDLNEIQKEICLFIESEAFDTKNLIIHLESIIPSYMLPSKIIFRQNSL